MVEVGTRRASQHALSPEDAPMTPLRQRFVGRPASPQLCRQYDRKLHLSRRLFRQVFRCLARCARPRRRPDLASLSGYREKSFLVDVQSSGLRPTVPVPHDAAAGLSGVEFTRPFALHILPQVAERAALRAVPSRPVAKARRDSASAIVRFADQLGLRAAPLASIPLRSTHRHLMTHAPRFSPYLLFPSRRTPHRRAERPRPSRHVALLPATSPLRALAPRTLPDSPTLDALRRSALQSW